MTGHNRRGNITGSATGYDIGAALMVIGGVVEIVFGVRAENQSLEDLATPLTAVESGESSTVESHGSRE